MFAQLDLIADEILAEENELRDFKESLITRRAEFEQHRTKCDRRNKSIKSFANSLNEFLSDTKSKLLKMIVQYDESESQRVPHGPLMPAGRVMLESFGSLADTFMQGCFALIEETANHWQIKSAAQIQERARIVEA